MGSVLRPWPRTTSSLLSAGPTPIRMPWRRLAPCWSRLTGTAGWWSMSWRTPTRPLRPDLPEPGHLRGKDEVRAGDEQHGPRPGRDGCRGCHVRGEGSASHGGPARLADELRAEQDHAMALERDKKLLEAQVKDASNRVDDAEQNALKGGKKAIAKMETRIHELESEMDAENRRCQDAHKNLRKSERAVKELTYQHDEDNKNHERMQSLIDQLQSKIKSYKKQIEEAEEIAALNLAKYRKVAGALGDAEAAADANEQAMAMRKARAKSASLGL